jgi:uncharacterized membrane protein YtjA (UPF0391 family)
MGSALPNARILQFRLYYQVEIRHLPNFSSKISNPLTVADTRDGTTRLWQSRGRYIEMFGLPGSVRLVASHPIGLFFPVISIIAGLFGFTGISATAAGTAKVLFFIFIAILRPCSSSGYWWDRRFSNPAGAGKGRRASTHTPARSMPRRDTLFLISGNPWARESVASGLIRSLFI